MWHYCVLLTISDDGTPSVWQRYAFSDRAEAARLVDKHNQGLLLGRHAPDPRTIAVLVSGEPGRAPAGFVFEAATA